MLHFLKILYHIDMDFRRKSALWNTAQHNATHCVSYDHNIKRFRRMAKSSHSAVQQNGCKKHCFLLAYDIISCFIQYVNSEFISLKTFHHRTLKMQKPYHRLSVQYGFR